MIDLYNYSLQKVYEYVSGPKVKDSYGLNFRCPFCGDSKKSKVKKRGHLYKKDSSYHCFNCGANYSAYKFLAILQGKELKDVKKDIIYEFKDMSASSLLNQVFINDDTEEIQVKPVEEREELNFKNSWVDLYKSPDAVKILEDRLIDKAPFLPKTWKLFYENEMNRIVIPWYRSGKMRYYQCRAINAKQNCKYLFPKNMPKDIFGADDLDLSYPYILYTEGVLDAIFVKNCIAIGGVSPTIGQMEILQPYLINRRLVLFPDNPWIDETSKKNIFKLAQTNPETLVYCWSKDCPYKDVNEYVVEVGNVKLFADGEELESKFLKASQMKIMLMFGKDKF